MSLRLREIHCRRFSYGAGSARTSQLPHYEFSALFALFFFGDKLFHASSPDGNCWVSISQPGSKNIATAFAPIGGNLLSFLKDLSAELDQRGVALTWIRHIPPDQADQIAEALGGTNRFVRRPDGRDESEDRYPQVEWNLQSLLPLAAQDTELPKMFGGPEFSNWRYQIKRYTHAYGKPLIRAFNSLHDEAKVDALTSRIAQDMGTIEDPHRGERAMAPVRRFLSRLRMTQAEHFGRVLELEGEIAGVWIAGAVTKNVAAAHVHLADRRRRGASQVCFIDGMREARMRGFERICLGGSETSDLLHFKAWNFGRAFKHHGALRYLSELEVVALKADASNGRFHEAFFDRAHRAHSSGARPGSTP